MVDKLHQGGFMCLCLQNTCRVRLARLGRQVLILEIMGSNPIRGTNKISKKYTLPKGVFFVFVYPRMG